MVVSVLTWNFCHTYTRNWDSYPKSYDIVIYFGLIFLSLTIQRICISCKVFQRHCRLVVVEVMEDGRSLVSMVLETYQALSVVAFSWTAGVFNSVSFDEMTQLNSHPWKEIHQFPVVTITCPGTCSGNVFKGWLIWAEERLRTLNPTTKECEEATCQRLASGSFSLWPDFLYHRKGCTFHTRLPGNWAKMIWSFCSNSLEVLHLQTYLLRWLLLLLL